MRSFTTAVLSLVLASFTLSVTPLYAQRKLEINDQMVKLALTHPEVQQAAAESAVISVWAPEIAPAIVAVMSQAALIDEAGGERGVVIFTTLAGTPMIITPTNQAPWTDIQQLGPSIKKSGKQVGRASSDKWKHAMFRDLRMRDDVPLIRRGRTTWGKKEQATPVFIEAGNDSNGLAGTGPFVRLFTDLGYLTMGDSFVGSFVGYKEEELFDAPKHRTKYVIAKNSGGGYSIFSRNNERYCAAEENGSMIEVNFRSGTIEERERFELEPVETGGFLIRSLRKESHFASGDNYLLVK